MDFQSVALPTELSGPLKESLRGISRSVFASSWSRNGAVGEKRTYRLIRNYLHHNLIENTHLTLFIDIHLN